MQALYAKKAFLPQGFEDDIRLDIDATGNITSIKTGAKPETGDMIADILIPGMPNVHSHAFQRAIAGLTEYTSSGSDTFWTWRSLMYHLANKVTPDDVVAIASQLYMELLKSGYTSVAEFHYIHGMADENAPLDREMSLAIFEAAKQTGIGLTHLPVLYEVSGFGAADPVLQQRTFLHTAETFVDLVESLQASAKIEPDIDLGIGFHSLRAVTPQSLAEISTWASHAMPDRPIHIHIAEQELEVRNCLEFYEARPVEWLLGNAPVNENWCLIHATHMIAKEIKGAGGAGAVIGLAPTTEANLGDGFFELPAWLEAKGSLGIGSDSNVCTSPAEELRLLEYGSRLRERRRLISTSPEHPGTGAFLWSTAARGGARALGRKAGTIAVGNKADVLNIDGAHPALCAAGAGDILNALVFGPSQGAIQDVYVGGVRAIEGGKHAAEADISACYRKTVSALLDL